MGLSSDLILQFVKATKDNKKTTNEATVYGTIVYDGKPYVKLDGSDLLTPISTTTNVVDGERVTVLIKNHMATVTGNISSPAARTEEVEKVGTQVSEFEIVMAYKVTTEDLEAVNASIDNLRAKIASFDNMEAVYADIEKLEAKFADIKHITAEDMEVINATIESLEATFGEFTDLSTEDLEAINAEIGNLKAYTADFTYVSAEVLEAVKASIKQLAVDKLSVKDADIKYANIDFANIGEAAIRKILADSGLIKDLIVGDGTITGELIGVTIRGNLIEGDTIIADSLIIRGENGLYHKLNLEGGAIATETVTEEDLQNGLDGRVLIAKSVTAEKVSVKDLYAFGATIGGFKLTDHSLYSGVKESSDNSTKGVYLDRDGQFVLGDADNYIKFVKVMNADGSEATDDNGDPIYKLEISAESILFGANSKASADDIKALTEHVKIGTVIDEETGDEKPCVELSEGDSDFKQIITNTKTMFTDGSNVGTEIDNKGVSTENVTVRNVLRVGNWGLVQRANGNLGITSKVGGM